MTTHTLITAGLMVGLVSAVGGFIVGWIAHGEQNRIYHDSRRRHAAHLERLAERAHPGCDAVREVVYVPVPVSTPVPVPVAVAGLGWRPPMPSTPIGAGHPAPALSPVRLAGEDR